MITNMTEGQYQEQQGLADNAGQSADIDDEVWTTRDGRKLKVGDMEESHVRNTLRMLIRRGRKRNEKIAELKVIFEQMQSELRRYRARDQMTMEPDDWPDAWFDDEDRKWGSGS